LPLRAPPSKIGNVAPGPADQVKAPPENSDDNAVEAKPIAPVRLIAGKKAARAAPIRAFSARS